MRSAYRVDDELRLTAEATIGATMAGTAVSDIEDTVPCRVLRRRRVDEVTFSNVHGRDVLADRDVVIVDTAAADIEAVRRRLGA